MYSFDKVIIPSFDILKSIVHSDKNVITIMKRNHWTLSTNTVNKLMVNLDLLRTEGVPETNFPKYLISKPRAFALDANSFKEIVDKVKDTGFDPSKTTFLIAIHAFSSMSEASWREKMDVYKRWGWSEDQIQTAFRNNPHCMKASEKKIMAVMNFFVNEMGHQSLSIAQHPRVFTCSLKERIIPRCSVIRILVSRGLIKEKISMSTISTMVDKSFVEKFVIKYEQQVPELMKVFQGQLHYVDYLISYIYSVCSPFLFMHVLLSTKYSYIWIWLPTRFFFMVLLKMVFITWSSLLILLLPTGTTNLVIQPIIP
ncbi:uncharacterized protein LOC113321663 [Papaver somniferum]|uniref:uncharacterized protein LOC113321663 n=1 Tax=Papaver somniferum TaxID=3469 RepID=UPI000E6FD15C|nr:uncharacterized protein LOC113321663 [Papaver somniferum]